jgi:hypothetical protein
MQDGVGAAEFAEKYHIEMVDPIKRFYSNVWSAARLQEV